MGKSQKLGNMPNAPAFSAGTGNVGLTYFQGVLVSPA